MIDNYLVLSDIHEQYQNFNPQQIRDKFKDVEMTAILIAGDITNRGFKIIHTGTPVDYLINQEKDITNWFQDLKDTFNCPIYFIPGNHDINMQKWTPKIEGVYNIYNQVKDSILGVSLSPCYDIPKLKDTWDNMVCNQSVESRYYNKFKDKKDVKIILSHCPPYQHLDKTFDDNNIGSKGLVKLINNLKPRLVICGHVHEATGVSNIGDTTILNTATKCNLVTSSEDKIWIKSF